MRTRTLSGGGGPNMSIDELNEEVVLCRDLFMDRDPRRSLCQFPTNRVQKLPQIRSSDSRPVDEDFRVQVNDHLHGLLVPESVDTERDDSTVQKGLLPPQRLGCRCHPLSTLWEINRLSEGAGMNRAAGGQRTRTAVSDSLPRVVIVGGGFGGLAAAKALRKALGHIMLFDRNNHHVFQPLLYQVATAVLTPGQIGAPLRGILGKQSNTTVILGEVIGVDKEQRIAGERIFSKMVIWTAGVAPSPAGKWLDVPTDHAGRVCVNDDLSVSEHPHVFVIGDTASLHQRNLRISVFVQWVWTYLTGTRGSRLIVTHAVSTR